MDNLRSILLLIATMMCVSQSWCQSGEEEAKVQQVVIDFFEGFSKNRKELVDRVVTPDFIILEQGVVWNADSVTRYMTKPRPADFSRINTFEFQQTEIYGSSAMTFYLNRADIHINGRDRTVRWLESAFFIKDGDRWRMKLLHSTRLESK
jgi:hypothetical protein